MPFEMPSQISDETDMPACKDATLTAEVQYGTNPAQLENMRFMRHVEHCANLYAQARDEIAISYEEANEPKSNGAERTKAINEWNETIRFYRDVLGL